MNAKERRQSPRMTVNGLAYVNLAPDNGGIILNISEGGLCFQSTSPVYRTEKIRLWFSHRNQKLEPAPGQAPKREPYTKGVSRFIQAETTLAWTDNSRKMGGLRFTNLPPEARKEIREWISQPALVNFHQRPAPFFPSLSKPYVNLKSSRADIARRASSILDALFQRLPLSRLRTGFSGGLVGGVLGSTLVLSVFLLLTHGRGPGDTLIQLGQRLGGTYSPQSTSPAPPATSPQLALTSAEPPPVAPESKPQPDKPSAEPHALAAPPMQPPPRQKLLSTAVPTAASSHAKLQPAHHAIPASSVPIVKPFDASAMTSPAPSPSAPSMVVAPAVDPGAPAPRPTAPEMELANPPAAHIEPSKVADTITHSEKYLELGRFKEKFLSDKTTSELSHLGFPATVVQRNRFFSKSYQVLVGPYATDREAIAAQKNLASLGFKPRSYERGKRDFFLPPALKASGSRLPVGDCVISWESYTPNAVVKFADERGTNVSTAAKWVKRTAKYPLDAVVYVRNPDGSRSLLEVRFSGMDRALVLGAGEHSSEH